VLQTESTSPGKEKAVKILIKTVWRREDGIEISPESEKMAENVPMKLKKKADKSTVREQKL
jgi:site-specific DNA recombinase